MDGCKRPMGLSIATEKGQQATYGQTHSGHRIEARHFCPGREPCYKSALCRWLKCPRAVIKSIKMARRLIRLLETIAFPLFQKIKQAVKDDALRTDMNKYLENQHLFWKTFLAICCPLKEGVERKIKSISFLWYGSKELEKLYLQRLPEWFLSNKKSKEKKKTYLRLTQECTEDWSLLRFRNWI